MGILGNNVLVIIKDVIPGEEVCFDYAMTDTADANEWECQCGTNRCRGKVTPNDWKNPELQKRYKGYFANYIQNKIDKLDKQALLEQTSMTSVPTMQL